MDQLRAESRYRRERLALYRARLYAGRATDRSRLAELERGCEEARARLNRAERQGNVSTAERVITGTRVHRTLRRERESMPPRGVKKGTKRARQYEHVKESQKQQGASEGRAEEIAARTVNKEKARSGESRQRSRTSTQDKSPGQRGGQRSGTRRAEGPHPRPALQRGEAAQHRRPLEHEQEPAAEGRRRQEELGPRVRGPSRSTPRPSRAARRGR